MGCFSFYRAEWRHNITSEKYLITLLDLAIKSPHMWWLLTCDLGSRAFFKLLRQAHCVVVSKYKEEAVLSVFHTSAGAVDNA